MASLRILGTQAEANEIWRLLAQHAHVSQKFPKRYPSRAHSQGERFYWNISIDLQQKQAENEENENG